MRSIDFWWISVFLGLTTTWGILVREWRTFTGTTLISTRGWIVGVMTAWTVAWLLGSSPAMMTSEQADHLWYAASILSLCPPISVLGARRPGMKAWPWFVLVPMLLVLGWPIVALRFHSREWQGIHLESPQLIAFILILVMGVGNYCGTRFTVAALVYGTAVALSVVCMSSVKPAFLADRDLVRTWCLILLCLAVISAKLSPPQAAVTNLDRLWFDFFDTFGIVWGRRIQDRINYLAEHEHLAVRLELTGFDWLPPDSTKAGPSENEEGLPTRHCCSLPSTSRSSREATRVEHLMRWLLRRFVDPQWIDQRLGNSSQQQVTSFLVDS